MEGNHNCAKMVIAGARGEDGALIFIDKESSIYLTEEDRKVNQCFRCKMPAKKWGGLAMLCAGLAVVGCIALVVCTGGAAAPALLTFAAVSAWGTGVAVAGMVGALIVETYKELHDCDILIDDQIPWQSVHNKVTFQKQKALLNSSYMICTQGGTLNLIVNDVAASKAAKLFSKNNAKEILWQAGSKLLNGIVGGLTGGGSLPGVVLTIGFDIYGEDSKSNQDPSSLSDDAKQSAIETGVGTVVDATQSGAKHGISILQTKIWESVMLLRILTDAGDDAVNSAANMASMARNAPKDIWTDFGKGLGAGIFGAVLVFGIDQFSNKKEKELEDDTMNQSKTINKEDADSHIGVYATKA